MAGAQVAISALPASTTIASTDILVAVIGGTTKKITGGNLRAQMFGFAATDPLNCGVLTAVGNSTVTGTLGGITTLSCTTVTATNLGGTLTTAAQANITSLGTLSVLNVSGPSNIINATGAGTSAQYIAMTNNSAQFIMGVAGSAADSLFSGSPAYSVGFGSTVPAKVLTLATNNIVRLTLDTNGALTFATAASKIIPGVTSFSHRNNADTQDNFILTDAGNASVRGNLVIGGTTVSFSSAVVKILQGATSLSIRDNADTTDTILISSAGITLTRSLLTAVSVTGQAGLNIPHGVAPTSPVNGDVWSTTTTLNFRLNGVTKSITMT